jgi:hypothetical protein
MPSPSTLDTCRANQVSAKPSLVAWFASDHITVKHEPLRECTERNKQHGKARQGTDLQTKWYSWSSSRLSSYGSASSM